jgi:uncharacterized protein
MLVVLSIGQSLTGAFSSFLIGLAKSGLPGAATVSIPLMADQFGAKTSVGLVLPTLITGDILALIFYRRHAQWGIIARVLPLAVVGIVIGWLLLGAIGNPALKRTIGVVAILLVVLNLLSKRFDFAFVREARMLGPLVGIAAGITTALANAAGPLVTVYLLWAGLEKKAFVGTAAWFFFTVNCIKLPFFVQRGMITAQTLPLNAIAIPFVILGAFSGVALLKRIDQRAFDMVVQVLIVAASAKLLLDA